VFFGVTQGWMALAGVLAAIGAAVTVCTTAMIYASLKPVAEWANRYTLPGYLIFAAMTGLVLLHALLSAFGLGSRGLAATALVATLAGWAFKEAIWRHNDRLDMPATANSATGLAGGTVRSVEWPHTEKNYLLKEMGFRVARKHAERLRNLVRLAAFAAPALLLAVALLGVPAMALVAALLAPIVQLAGMLVERWLFFAQARHTVMLYYGA
jgi:DMSO reductase anchor subunit